MRRRWWRLYHRQEASDVKRKLNDALAASHAARVQLVETEHRLRRANAIAATADEIGKRNGFYDLWIETFQLR